MFFYEKTIGDKRQETKRVYQNSEIFKKKRSIKKQERVDKAYQEKNKDSKRGYKYASGMAHNEANPLHTHTHTIYIYIYTCIKSVILLFSYFI